MRDKVLSLEEVTVQIDGQLILREISLDVARGELLVLVGPSGGGKTVLLKTMVGLFTPSQGQVFCEGVNFLTMNDNAKRRLAQRIGVQFQKSALFDSLTAGENVAFPIREHFPERSELEVQRRVDFCLESVNLLKSKDLLPHELSGGMRIRLGMARAIALSPDILFYDDPTAGLDPINSDRMAQLILDLKAQNDSTVVVITHDMARAYQLAGGHGGRICLVANQGLIETGSPEFTRTHSDPRVRQFIQGQLTGPLVWG